MYVSFWRDPAALPPDRGKVMRVNFPGTRARHGRGVNQEITKPPGQTADDIRGPVRRASMGAAGMIGKEFQLFRRWRRFWRILPPSNALWVCSLSFPAGFFGPLPLVLLMPRVIARGHAI